MRTPLLLLALFATLTTVAHAETQEQVITQFFNNATASYPAGTCDIFYGSGPTRKADAGTCAAQGRIRPDGWANHWFGSFYFTYQLGDEYYHTAAWNFINGKFVDFNSRDEDVTVIEATPMSLEYRYKRKPSAIAQVLYYYHWRFELEADGSLNVMLEFSEGAAPTYYFQRLTRY